MNNLVINETKNPPSFDISEKGILGLLDVKESSYKDMAGI